MWVDASRNETAIANELLSRPLTRQEIRVLCLVAEGYSNPDIALLIHISPATVKTHMARIIAKLRVQNRTQAAVKAIRLGIIRSD